MIKKVSCRSLTALLIAFTTVLAVYNSKAQAEQNIVFILADDLGYDDLGCYGNKHHRTPHIDRLAQSGMRFIHAYAAPTCSPTRAAFLTGKAPGRVHVTDFLSTEGSVQNPMGQGYPYPERSSLIQPATPQAGLRAQEFTIAEAFRKNGYTTGIIGKWHVGSITPQECGFDFIREIGDNKFPRFKDEVFMTERKANAAVDFFEKYRDKPFFLYLAFHAVHGPLDAEPERIKQFANAPKPILAAMLSHMDDAVGQVVEALEKSKLREKTTVIFMSDNGAASSRPGQIFRGHKGFLYEGGVRVPLIVDWPGTTPAGSECHAVMTVADWYPTLLEMAKLPPEPQQHLDGISQVPVLQGKSKSVRNKVYWHYPHWFRPHRASCNTPCSAIREGEWKLFEFFEDETIELYNLNEDPGEKSNLAEQSPERARDMLASLRKWRKDAGVLIPEKKQNQQEKGVIIPLTKGCEIVPTERDI